MDSPEKFADKYVAKKVKEAHENASEDGLEKKRRLYASLLTFSKELSEIKEFCKTSEDCNSCNELCPFFKIDDGCAWCVEPSQFDIEFIDKAVRELSEAGIIIK